MSKAKIGSVLMILICAGATAAALLWSGSLDRSRLQNWLDAAGLWAPVLYMSIYVVSTLLVLPSTALNLLGGAFFGPIRGMVWTSLAAILAAVIGFVFARTIGRAAVTRRLAGRWQAMDAELRQGALFYMFAIRLVPILPYGLVNFAAGLTSISFRDYLLGTILGTAPSVLPFVLLGSYGLQALQTGDILPLLGALALTGLLVAGANWYRRRRTFPQQAKVSRAIKDSSIHPSEDYHNR
ncbi:MAG: TVP38/TMEM64 family protein [Leptolyngbyaceae cyanobacterium SL_1_1]|nr:TVP38/TMEM64 family protein [Leptolyngbyaceae cyanobacterium RM1_1_2]NJO09540.1 TVP38/TMEM64 family protein [Leptolyngbyaceae cyanobacterium SL_1_1]